MPVFLYGGEIIDYTQTDLGQLQKIDNKAFRTILQAPTYTAVESLRGEVGASCATSRDMKMKILFVRHILDDGNELAQRIFLDEYERQNTKWSKQIASYLNILKLTLSKISSMSRTTLTKIITEWDTDQWTMGIRDKKTLNLYGMFKTGIKEERYFTNDEASKLMFRARTDTLDLNWRKKNGLPSDRTCPNCYHQETLKHFLLDCDDYNEIRAKYTFFARPYNEDANELMGNLLVLSNCEDENDISSRKQALLDMWKKRKRNLINL